MIEPDEDDDWWKRGRSPDNDREDVEEDADGETVIACPHCGADVFDDAEQCPACGSWITGNQRASTGSPSWFVVLGVIVALLTILTWIVHWR